MRRPGIWLAFILAVVVGIVGGLAAFRWIGPLSVPSARPSVSQSRAGSSTPTPSPSASSSASSSPSPTSTPATTPATSPKPTPTPTPTPSPSEPPPFTERALLQPPEFRQHGWSESKRTRSWDGLPDEQITSCTEVTKQDGPIKAAYAATFTGDDIDAGETVVRFESTAAAQKAVVMLLNRIDICIPGGGESTGLDSKPMASPQADGLSELYLWNTTGEPSTEGFFGLARAGDRIAVLSLTSDITDPVDLTDVRSLMLQAGRRLV